MSDWEFIYLEGVHMKKLTLIVMSFGLFALAAAPAFAHHSFAAEFDANKPVTMTGTVTKNRMDESARLVLR